MYLPFCHLDVEKDTQNHFRHSVNSFGLLQGCRMSASKSDRDVKYLVAEPSDVNKV